MSFIPKFIQKLSNSKKTQVYVLLFISLLSYINIGQHDFNLDDLIIQNNIPSVKEGLMGCFKVFGNSFDFIDYRPISLFTFSIEQLIFGKLNSAVSHWVNIGLLFLCVLLLHSFLFRLNIKHAKLIAFSAAVIFAAHPIHSNVVASIKSRDCLLSFIFGFAALNVLLTHLQALNPSFWQTFRRLILVFVFFVLATLSKLDATSYIILFPLTYFFFSNAKLPARILQSLSLGYLLFISFVLTRVEFVNKVILTAEEAEKAPPIPIKFTENPLIVYDGFLPKISSALTSFFFYVKFHIIPKGYYFFFGYDMIEIGPSLNTYSWFGLILVAILFVLFILTLKKQPIISFGIAFFVASLAYCLNIYQPVSGIIAPRLAFIASAGFCIALAGVIVLLSTFLGNNSSKFKEFDKTSILVSLLLALILIPFTINRNSVWKDSNTLISRDMPHLEKSFEAHRIAIGHYNRLSASRNNIKEGKEALSKSLKHAHKASKIFSKDQYIEESILYNTFLLEEYESAFYHGRWILENFDKSYITYEVLGDILVEKEFPDSAIYYYKKLINIAPEDNIPYLKYSETMVQSNRLDEAIDVNRSLVGQSKQAYYPLESLIYLYLEKGDTVKAANSFFHSIDEGNPNLQYGNALIEYYERNGLEKEWNNFLSGKREEL